MRCVRVIPVVLLTLSILAAFPPPAAAIVNKPSTVSPSNGRVDVSANPTLVSSPYSGDFEHKATGWQIYDDSDLTSLVWTRASTVGEIETVVNAANGTFAGGLAGKTSLNPNTCYYWRLLYLNQYDTPSPWSDTGFFITATVTWYLAEGATDGGFETWVLVQNPGSTDAVVDIEFMTDQGLVDGPRGDLVPPNSRRSYNVGSYVTTYDVSTKVTASSGTIVCERAVYGPERVWGHDSIGVTSPASTWYLAEGATEGGFETWVLVQNPNPVPVTVNLSLQTDGGLLTPGELQDMSIPANSRHSFDIGLYARTYQVSTTVVSTGGDVVCERAMYGNGRQWGHDSIGATDPTFNWVFAEGCTGEGFETWLLVQNPMGYQQEVALFFCDEQGVLAMNPPRFIIPASSRMSVNVGSYVQSYNVSVNVFTWNETGQQPDTTGRIICERAMYDTARTWGHDSIGTPFPPGRAWCLAEGSTAGGMEDWVLVYNYSDADLNPANVQLVFMTDSGIVMGPAVSIPAFARRSFNIGDYVDTYDVSVLVDSDNFVCCERSMYGPGRSWAHNSIGYILGLGDIQAASAGASAASAARNTAIPGFDASAYGRALLEAAGGSAH